MNTLWPRMKTWLEETIKKEIPCHVEGAINRMVLLLVGERVRRTATVVVDKVVRDLIEEQIRTALDLGVILNRLS